jgi:cell division protease FtsH
VESKEQPEKKPQAPNLKANLGYFVATMLIIVGVNSYFFSSSHTKPIPYSEFLRLVDDGSVVNATLSEDRISGELKPEKDQKDNRHFATIPAKDDALTQRLYSKNIPFSVELKDPYVGFLFSWILPVFFIFFVWSVVGKRIGGVGGGLLSMTKSKAKIFMDSAVKTTFADVAGVEEAKDELSEIVSYLRDPKRCARLGGRAPKGVLLVGPPGTGKTLLARAVAGEANVTFFSINGSEFVEMFVGLGAARVRDLFVQARKQAPCILFIDEVDALGKSRASSFSGLGGNDEKEQTLNQLLAEMDGFDSTVGVILIAATNRPEVLDPALLRAGRFDRQVMLGNPDHQARVQILQVHVKKVKLDAAVDLNRIASMTPGFSGADLANLVNEATLIGTRKDEDSVTEMDFSEAFERIVAGLQKKSKVMNPAERRHVAYHEMGHATVALGLDVADKVQKISIIPRGMSALGYTLQRPLEDRYLLDEEEMFSKIAVLLGGRAAEKMFFQKVSTGAADDLAKASNIARAMVTQFGMSKTLGLESFDERRSPMLQSAFEASLKQVSEETAREIDVEVRSILDRCFQLALNTLQTNRMFLEEAAVRLLETETLDESQIAALWTGHKKTSLGAEFPVPRQISIS